GSIMLIGGTTSYPDLAVHTDLYSPSTGNFTQGPDLVTARERAAATILADGRVVVAGGDATNSTMYAPVVSDVEIYDWSADAFSRTGDLLVDRDTFTMSLLTHAPAAGKLLVVGGFSGSVLAQQSVEVLNPDADYFAVANTLTLPDGASGQAYAAALLSMNSTLSNSFLGYTVAWGALPPGVTL